MIEENNLRTCEKCENTYDESLFEGNDAICRYCRAEMEVLNGEIITKENIGKVIQNQFNRRGQ